MMKNVIKLIFLASVLLSLCHPLLAQDKSSSPIKGYSIVYTMDAKIADADTTGKSVKQKERIKKALRAKANEKTMSLHLDVTDNYVRIQRSAIESLIFINKKKNWLKVKHKDGKISSINIDFGKGSIPGGRTDSFLFPLKWVKGHQRIAGYRCKQAIINLKDKEFKKINIWVTRKLPSTYWGIMNYSKPPQGAILQMELVANDNISLIITAQSVKKGKWPLSHFWPTEAKKEIKEEKKLTPNYTGASAFKFGFARLVRQREVIGEKHMYHKSTQVYIDTTGKVAFNAIVSGNFFQPDKYDSLAVYGDSLVLPKRFVMVRKGEDKTAEPSDNNPFSKLKEKAQYGVLTVDGQWILKPVYDAIDTRFQSRWIVTKDGKQSLFTPQGFALPFAFDTVYQMSKRYYVVVNDGNWGVYDRKQKKTVIPLKYEDIDYCYGCEAEGNYVMAKKKGKWGVVNLRNKVLIPFKYDHKHWNMRSDEWVTSFYNEAGQQLVINLNDQSVKICQPQTERHTADTIELPQGFKRIEKNDKYGLLNPQGQQILPYKYDYIRYDAAAQDDYGLPAPYIAIRYRSKWGVADTTGQIVVKPIYTTGITFLDEGFFLCERKISDGHYVNALLDSTGKSVLPKAYDDIEPEKTYNKIDSLEIPFLKIEEAGKIGFYNPKTKVFVKPQFKKIDKYTFLTNILGGLNFKKGENEGLINVNTGKVEMPALYPYIRGEETKLGFMIVSDKKLYGLYDYHRHKLVVPLKYDNIIADSTTGLLKIYKDDYVGLMNYKGKELIAPVYKYLQKYNQQFYAVRQQDSAQHYFFRLYNIEKKQYLHLGNDTIVNINKKGLLTIKREGKELFYNLMKRKIIKGAYLEGGAPEAIGGVFSNRVHARKNGKIGIISITGQVLIPFKYNRIFSFHKGIALVLKGKDNLDRPLYGYIDTTGREVVPAQYVFDRNRYSGDYFMNDKLVLQQAGDRYYDYKLGLATRDGQVVVKPIYDKIIPQEKGKLLLVKKDGKYGILAADGKVILPTVFDDIALKERPLYSKTYQFSFPVLGKRYGVWQYYNRNGKTVGDVKAKTKITFEISRWGY